MEIVAVNNFITTQSQSPSVLGYYATFSALTSKNATQKASTVTIIEDSPLSLLFSPFLVYGTIIIFFAIFFAGLLYQIISKTADFKRTISTLVVAFVVASIPLTLRTALEVTSFSTRAGLGEIPSNVQIQTLITQSIVITWETQTEKIGSVRMGKTPLTDQESKLYIGDLGKRVKSHTVKIENLQKGTVYEIEILSGNTWYDNNGKPLQFQLKDL